MRHRLCGKTARYGNSRANIDTVDCAQPHLGEVYANIDIPGDDFPNSTRLEAYQDECSPALEAPDRPSRTTARREQVRNLGSWIIPSRHVWVVPDRHLNPPCEQIRRVTRVIPGPDEQPSTDAFLRMFFIDSIGERRQRTDRHP